MVTGGTAMKTMKFALLAIAAMVAASCVKENPEDQANKSDVKYVKMEFNAGISTKTQLKQGQNVTWYSTDKLSVFDNSATATTHNNQFVITQGGGKAAAVISGEVPEDATEFYACYPYKSTLTMTGTTVENLELSANQTAMSGSFQNGTASLMAKADADNNFEFKNITSLLRFTLPEDMASVKALTLMGNNDEVIAGKYNVDWNDGDPTVTVTAPEIYINMTAAKDTIAAGKDYYFTILPANFTKGFTVIATKRDGSQVALKTTKPIDYLATRNRILETKAMPSESFLDHTNYFVQYINGMDVTVAGYTFDNTEIKNGILVADVKNNMNNFAATGCYFISPNCQNANLDKNRNYNQALFIGADASVRSRLNVTANLGLVNGGPLFLFTNLDITNSAPQFIRTISAKADCTFGDIIIKDCHFIRNPMYFIYMANSSGYNITIDSLTIENCDIGFSQTTAYFFYEQNSLTDFVDVSIKNNIFYPSSGNTISEGFRLFDAYNSSTAGTNVTNFTLQNNTFIGTYLTTGALVEVLSLKGGIDCRYNLFDVGIKGTQYSFFGGGATGTDVKASAGGVTGNFSYTQKVVDGTSVRFDGPNSVFSGLSAQIVRFLTKSPLAGTWDVENGIYGTYDITTINADQQPSESAVIGAQRTPTPAINSAAANYSSVNLGIF